MLPLAASWIASRSLSSGARSRDPLDRNDGGVAVSCHAGAQHVVDMDDADRLAALGDDQDRYRGFG